MKERTPPTGTVRHAFAKAHPFPYTTDIEERYAEFDRWLEQVKNEALAEGWDEGSSTMRDIYGDTVETNPYRQEQDR